MHGTFPDASLSQSFALGSCPGASSMFELRCCNVGAPMSAILSFSSSLRVWRTLPTPGCPPRARPHRIGLPTNTASAPNASACFSAAPQHECHHSILQICQVMMHQTYEQHQRHKVQMMYAATWSSGWPNLEQSSQEIQDKQQVPDTVEGA